VLAHPPLINYGTTDEGWSTFRPRVEQLCQRADVRRVCEVGGGGDPLLPLEFTRRHDIEYVVLDISEEELAKAPDGYRKVQGDIGSAAFALRGEFDLVISKMLAEHVRDGRQLHRNIHQLLRPGGLAFHFFPTLFAPAFVANCLLPTELSGAILSNLQPDRGVGGRNGKFPAYYSWCRGPTRQQIQRLESEGYRVLIYDGFFGTHGYYARVGLGWADDWITTKLVGRPLPALTAFAQVTLERAN